MSQNISERIEEIANRLKLPLIADYKNHVKTDNVFEKKLLQLLEVQLVEKENKSIARRIKNAGFPVLKTIDTFEFDERLPYLRPEHVEELITCDFIEQKYNVIAFGGTGNGKTHIGIGIGIEAINKGYNVKFKKVSDIMIQLKKAEEENSLGQYIKNLNKCQLLILDELGYLIFSPKETGLIFQVLTDRYETKSTLITTHQEFSKWSDFLTDHSLTNVIIDRLAYKTKFLNMKGESYRLHEANKTV